MRDLIETTKQYKEWRLAVLIRDNFRCIKCGSKRNLEINHKIPLDHFIRVGEYDLNWILSFSNLFDIGNGETLCDLCHRKTESYAQKNFLNLGESIPIRGEVFLELKNIITGRVIRETFTNMIVTYGKNAIAQRLSGDSGAGEITWCATGTGTTAPALADTAMQTELARKQISTRSYTNNQAVLTTFFTTSESNGTLREAGLFGNAVGRTASSTPGSGQLYARVAINRTKSSNDTLTLTWTVTVG